MTKSKSKFGAPKYYSSVKKNLHEDSNFPRKKKMFGQHFLRKHSVVDHMIDKVSITSDKTTIMEIGCGDGFLTSAILEQTKCKELICFEIDHEWAKFVRNKITDPRLDLRLQNILELDLATLSEQAPLVLLANLPYQITFPIIFLIQKNKHLFQEGVIMVQDEVAHKILASHGKGYSSTSLFLQYHFSWEKMEKVEPGAFAPPPKIYSRLLYFKPKLEVQEIPQEADFWKFLKFCFRSPRQTLRNNLRTTHYNLSDFSDDLLKMRAQQLSFDEFLELWKKIINTNI